MDLHLKDKVVVLVGGTTGIGEAAALQFLEEGCTIAVCSHNVTKVEEFQKKIQTLGMEQRCMTACVDATNKEAVSAFAKEVKTKLGRIDVWVNLAGGNKHGPLAELSQEDYRYIVDLNLSTCLFGCQAAAGIMQEQKSGVILNISSEAARRPVAYRVLYGAIKSAIDVLTKGLAGELAPYGIRVNALAPGATDTVLMHKALHDNWEYSKRFIPIHRGGKPEEMASMLVHMASDTLGYMTGSIVEIDGGATTLKDTEFPWESPWGK